MDEKEKAVAYIKENKIDVILQQTLNSLYKTQPGSVFGYLAEELEKYASKPSVKLISGYSTKSFHDDHTRVSIEATCLVNNHAETTASAFVGYNSIDDTISLDDLKAVNDALHGVCILDQDTLDDKLKSLSEVSSSMTLTVSSALFKSSARLQKITTLQAFQQLINSDSLAMPLPIVSILNNGKHGPGKNNMASLAVCSNVGVTYIKSMEMIESIYNKVEETLRKKYPNNLPCISPNGGFNVSCDRPEQMIELVREAVGELELTPGTDFYFVLDCLASDFHSEVVPGQGSAKKGQTQSNSKHRYDWIEGQLKPTEDLCDFLEGLVENESIIGIVDALHHEDSEGYERLAKKIGPKCLLFSRSSIPYTGSVFKLNTTISHSMSQLQNMDRSNTILEAAVFEEGETLLSDLALVCGCSFIMFGANRGIRSKLYNQLSKLLQQNGDVKPAITAWKFMEVIPEEESAAEPEA